MSTTDGIVDWHRLARRLRWTVSLLGGGAVAGWLIAGAVTGQLTVAGLFVWVGVALGALFVAEVVLVGGSALRGMLRAGERGHRLAGGDVGLLPPQVGGRSPAADREQDR